MKYVAPLRDDEIQTLHDMHRYHPVRRQETEEYKALYALRAGVESTLSQGARRFNLRRSRYIGLARTHLQQTINATAMNVVRIAEWLRKGRSTPPKRPPGPFAAYSTDVCHPVHGKVATQST
jgi:DDE family transposase